MRKTALSLALAAATLGAALTAHVAVGASAPPPASPPFTVAQAQQGAAIYAERCAMCHGARQEGTFEIPALTGRFVANWAGRPLGDLHGYVGRAMPQFAPGSLAPDDQARVVAYLLAANGYPAGPTALSTTGTTLAVPLPPPPPPR